MSTDTECDEPKLDLSAKGPWQQLSTETNKAYAAFTQYLEMGPDVTQKDVAAKLGKTLSTIWNLSHRHQWVSRAAAWRQHLAAITAHALEKATRKTVELWAMRENALRELEWESAEKVNSFCVQALNQHL